MLRLSGGYFAVATLVWRPRSSRSSATLSPSVGGTTGVSVPGLAGYAPVLREALIYWATLAVAVASVAGVYLLVRRDASGWTPGRSAATRSPRPAPASGSGAARRLAYLVAAGGAGAVGALIALQTLYVEPTSIFNIQYSVYMLFMVLIGGMGTIEGPVLGALLLFALQETLSAYGAWYLVIVGGLAVAATLAASRGHGGSPASGSAGRCSRSATASASRRRRDPHPPAAPPPKHPLRTRSAADPHERRRRDRHGTAGPPRTPRPR